MSVEPRIDHYHRTHHRSLAGFELNNIDDVRLPHSVSGFHGTSKEAADAILSSGFRLSRNPYDWLGDGVYFFQDASERAWEWALDNHPHGAAVIGVDLRVIDCIDMLDTKWTKVISEAYDQFLDYFKRSSATLPRQTVGAHRLDREVINYIVRVLAEQGLPIRCVRACFAEGRPVYPDSALFDHGHVQIAVRDVEACITNMWLERTQ